MVSQPLSFSSCLVSLLLLHVPRQELPSCISCWFCFSSTPHVAVVNQTTAAMKELNMKNKSPKAMPLSSSSESEVEEEMVVVVKEPESTWNANVKGNRKKLSKHLSMKETTREVKWDKRRRQILQRRRVVKKVKEDGSMVEEEKENIGGIRRVRSLTDEDLDELRGSIELGFGFNEEDGGQDLRDTLPALDLYFAVTRQMSGPKIWSSASSATTPTATSSSYTLGGTPSPRSPNEKLPQSSPGDSWKIFTAGDNPQHVKTRLRHWAQVVACSVKQCS